MVAFLFAGQGSQYIGMGKDLYEAFPESRLIFDTADDALGFELKKVCFEGPAEKLKQTDISQPAIVTATMAAFEAFKARHKIVPRFMAGLSLGEYSALIASGVFSFREGVRLVRQRGLIMEEAARQKPGKMAAVLELPFEKIKEICVQSGAEIANLNAPGQIVITGKAESVTKAIALCNAAGAKRVIELEVSGGFHSSLMEDAAGQLRQAILATTRLTPAVAVVSNYTAMPEDTLGQVEENLVRQLYSPVRWIDSMKWLIGQEINHFIEFGPGKVLRGLMRKIDSSVQVNSIEKKDDLNAFIGNR